MLWAKDAERPGPVLPRWLTGGERRLDLRQHPRFFQDFARAANDACERIFGHVDREARLLLDPAVEAAEESASTGQANPFEHQVGDELRRRDLDRRSDDLYDRADGAGEGIADLHCADVDRLG